MAVLYADAGYQTLVAAERGELVTTTKPFCSLEVGILYFGKNTLSNLIKFKDRRTYV